MAGPFTGRLELDVRSPAEARRLHGLLHGRDSQLGVDLAPLEAQLMSLAARPGNGRQC